MSKFRGELDGCEYRGAWERSGADSVLWDAAISKRGLTLGWPSGKLLCGAMNDAVVHAMVRLAVEAHIPAAEPYPTRQAPGSRN